MPTDAWANFSTADVTITGAGVTLIQVVCRGLRAGEKVLILGWFRVTTGGTTTALTMNIERQNPLVTIGESTPAEAIYAAAGSTEDHVIMVTDNALLDDQIYDMGAVSATANSTMTQACILVLRVG